MRKKWARRVFFAIAAILFVPWLFLVAIIFANAAWKLMSPMLPAPSYIIVLGAGLSGAEPSLTLKLRLDKAAELANRFPDSKIVVSGGQGPTEVISEAESMRRYLVKIGVSDGRVLKEDKSKNTDENFLFSKRVIDGDQGFLGSSERLVVIYVSNGFHLARAGMTAKRAGYKFAYGAGAPTVWWRIPRDYLREDAAIMYHFFSDFFGVTEVEK